MLNGKFICLGDPIIENGKIVKYKIIETSNLPPLSFTIRNNNLSVYLNNSYFNFSSTKAGLEGSGFLEIDITVDPTDQL